MTFPLPAEVSIDEKLAAFDDTPLFMKSLPDDAMDNPAVSALQSLAYEGTPDGKYSVIICFNTTDRAQKLPKTSRSKGMTTSRANAFERPWVSILRASMRNPQTLYCSKHFCAIVRHVI